MKKLPAYWKEMLGEDWMPIEVTSLKHSLVARRDEIPNEARGLVDALASGARYILEEHSELTKAKAFPNCMKPVFSQLNARMLEFFVAFRGKDLMIEHSDEIYPSGQFRFLGKLKTNGITVVSWWLRRPGSK